MGYGLTTVIGGEYDPPELRRLQNVNHNNMTGEADGPTPENLSNVVRKPTLDQEDRYGANLASRPNTGLGTKTPNPPQVQQEEGGDEKSIDGMPNLLTSSPDGGYDATTASKDSRASSTNDVPSLVSRDGEEWETSSRSGEADAQDLENLTDPTEPEDNFNSNKASENGNNPWEEVIKKEMDAMQETGTFKICPPGYQFEREDVPQYTPLCMIYENK